MTQRFNPYQSPTCSIRDEFAIKGTQESLAKLIRSFTNREISSSKFEEELIEFCGSRDSAIHFAVHSMLMQFDDLNDHMACFSKQGWDYVQRLLLVLESSCRVETTSVATWAYRQIVAAFFFSSFCLSVLIFGWGSHLFLFSMPCGFVSIALSQLARHDTAEQDPYAHVIFPFASFSDLALTYRSTGFRKQRYPKQLECRSTRSPVIDAFCTIHLYLTWFLLGPVPLLFQVFPKINTNTRVVAA